MIVIICVLLVSVSCSVLDVWWLWCVVRCLLFVGGSLRLAVSCDLLIVCCACGWRLLLVGVCLSLLAVCCFLRAVVVGCGVSEVVVVLVFYVCCRYCVCCSSVVVRCGVCSQFVICCCLMCGVCCLL